MGVLQQNPCQEDHIGLTVRDDCLGDCWADDLPDSRNVEVRMRLLDRFRVWDLYNSSINDSGRV